MDFRDGPELHAFRMQVRSWLQQNLPPGFGTPGYRGPEDPEERIRFARSAPCTSMSPFHTSTIVRTLAWTYRSTSLPGFSVHKSTSPPHTMSHQILCSWMSSNVKHRTVSPTVRGLCRSRNAPRGAPPPQIRTCGTTASGSYLGVATPSRTSG